ncbi:MAG: LytTR family transcriptional regulator [Lachnospiraceae bacterium]|nr:LytTR family transcriptional regulator [Lachnospiraceae bacterium]
MKIVINEDSTRSDTEIIISCPILNPQLERLISLLRVMDLKLTGRQDGQTFILDAAKVLYIDTVDKHTFFYTQVAFYESDLRLYELEEKLTPYGFIRANKSCIINFNHINTIKADLDGRLLITMSNQEKLYVSRQYAPILKKRLEGK